MRPLKGDACGDGKQESFFLALYMVYGEPPTYTTCILSKVDSHALRVFHQATQCLQIKHTSSGCSLNRILGIFVYLV